MPPAGVSLCLIGNDQEWLDQVISLVEKGIDREQITFYVNNLDFVDPKAWVWFWHVANNCDLIVCDSLSATEHEIRMALAMSKESLPVMFRVRSGDDDDFVTLLHNISVLHYETLEELDQVLGAVFNG